jgi:hypothetical protein
MDGFVPLLFMLLLLSICIGTIASIVLAFLSRKRVFKSAIPLWVATANCIQLVVAVLAAYMAKSTGIGLTPSLVLSGVLLVSIFVTAEVSNKSNLNGSSSK